MLDNDTELQSMYTFTEEKSIPFKQQFLKTVQKELTNDKLSKFLGFSSGVVFLSLAPSFSSNLSPLYFIVPTTLGGLAIYT